MTSAVAECTRHGFPWGPSADPNRSAYLVRCMHVGTRFVVEIHSTNSNFCAMDYVEDLPNGDVRVEAGGHGDWDDLTNQMLKGKPPCPETEH